MPEFDKYDTGEAAAPVDTTRVASTGTMYIGKVNTAIPATLTDEAIKTAGFKTLGLFTEDGVEHEFSEETEDIKSWQAGVVRTIITGRDLTLKFAALESSKAVFQAYYGLTDKELDTSTTAGVLKMQIQAAASRAPFSALFVIEDGMEADGTTKRQWALHMDKAQVSEVESPKFANSEAITWGMTVKALGQSGKPLGTWEIHDQAIAGVAPVDPL